MRPDRCGPSGDAPPGILAPHGRIVSSTSSSSSGVLGRGVSEEVVDGAAVPVIIFGDGAARGCAIGAQAVILALQVLAGQQLAALQSEQSPKRS
jgi:hypothetical protein